MSNTIMVSGCWHDWSRKLIVPQLAWLWRWLPLRLQIKMSVSVTSNIPSKDYNHLDVHDLPTQLVKAPHCSMPRWHHQPGSLRTGKTMLVALNILSLTPPYTNLFEKLDVPQWVVLSFLSSRGRGIQSRAYGNWHKLLKHPCQVW